MRVLWEISSAKEPLTFRQLQSEANTNLSVQSARLTELLIAELVDHVGDGYVLTDLGRSLSVQIHPPNALGRTLGQGKVDQVYLQHFFAQLVDAAPAVWPATPAETPLGSKAEMHGNQGGAGRGVLKKPNHAIAYESYLFAISDGQPQPIHWNLGYDAASPATVDFTQRI